MLYDVRTYTCKPGGVPKQFELYAEHGFAVQTRHLGKPIVYGMVETGAINSFIHIWVYEDAADRMRRRANMMADPEWTAYLEKSQAAGYLLKQENQLVQSAPFVE